MNLWSMATGGGAPTSISFRVGHSRRQSMHERGTSIYQLGADLWVYEAIARWARRITMLPKWISVCQ